MTPEDAQPHLHIVADTKYFVVIDKPPGVCMHYQDGDHPVLPMLENLGYKHLHLVHRLDTATSGLLVLAKSAAVAALMFEEFNQHRVQKYYLALSAQKPKKKQGHMFGGLVKSRRGNYKLTLAPENPVYTQFFSYSVSQQTIPSLRLFALKPHSGKTHQLRVSLQSIGAPILGDARYAKDNSDRMYLHAYQLAFSLYDEHYCYQQLPKIGLWFTRIEIVHTIERLGDLSKLKWPSPMAKAVHAL